MFDKPKKIVFAQNVQGHILPRVELPNLHKNKNSEHNEGIFEEFQEETSRFFNNRFKR